jgi:hypothetical protein
MSREWKPGDVAMVRVSEEYAPEVAVSSDRQWFVAGPRLGSRHGWYHANVEVIRPLVVIDPEDAEQVERLASTDALRGLGGSFDSLAYNLADALREFANPTPPKPQEPMGLGAVVEDAEGERYVRHADCNHPERPWQALNGSIWNYAALDVVRVLSEGVQP